MMSYAFADLIADVSTLCLEYSPAEARGVAVIERLGESMDFDAAALSMCEPYGKRHVTLVNVDYSPNVLAYLNGGFTTNDPAFHTMRFQDPRPLRWCDIPNYTSGFSVKGVFEPSGFHEGVTICLFASGRRYTGSLHLSTRGQRPLHADAIRCLAAMRPVLSTLLDGLRAAPSPDWPTHLLDAQEAGMWHSSGEISPVPGVPFGPNLADRRSDLFRHLTSTINHLTGHERTFYWVGKSKPLKVTIGPITAGWLVVLREEQLPYGLTPRELQVLWELAFGLSNIEIGSRLYISPRTVATHVENLLLKFGCCSRGALVAHGISRSIVASTD